MSITNPVKLSLLPSMIIVSCLLETGKLWDQSQEAEKPSAKVVDDVFNFLSLELPDVVCFDQLSGVLFSDQISSFCIFFLLFRQKREKVFLSIGSWFLKAANSLRWATQICLLRFIYLLSNLYTHFISTIFLLFSSEK